MKRGTVLDAETAADGSCQRHNGCGAGINQAFRKYNVIRGIRENGKAFLYQGPGRFESSLDVGIECGLIADDLDFYPVRKTDFTAKMRGSDGLVCRVTTRRIGEQEVTLGVDEVEQGFFGAVEVDAAHGHGHHLGAGGFYGGLGLRTVLVLTGANDEPRLKCFACDDEGFHRFIVKRVARISG